MEQKIETSMRDWCGIPVCVGDTVLFVSTIVPRVFDNFKYLDPETGDMCGVVTVPRTPRFWGWNVAHKSEIIMFEGKPHITAPNPAPGPVGSATMIIPVDLFWDMYCDQVTFTGNTFAIEGISDNHEKFFRFFFKKELLNKN